MAAVAQRYQSFEIPIFLKLYDFIAKKERRNGMLAGAAPVTFRVEKWTFHADGPARRGKYATLNVES